MKYRNVFKKIAGVALIIIGLLALVTPLTPGSWLVFVGAELLGVRILFLEKLKRYLRPPRTGDSDTPPQDRSRQG